jgi:hypothetical protein
MVAGIEPAVIGMAEAIEFADVDHGSDLARRFMASSVSDVPVRHGIQMPKVAKVGTSTRAREEIARNRRRKFPSKRSDCSDATRAPSLRRVRRPDRGAGWVACHPRG